MADHDARRVLATLAGEETAEESEQADDWAAAQYRDRIDAATAATEDLASATRYVAERDLEALEHAVERADSDLSKRSEEGRAALEALRRLRAAAGNFHASDGPRFPSENGAGSG